MRPLLLALSCLALAPPVASAAAASGCQLVKVADVAVEVTPSGAVLVPVTIGGRELRMILDLRSGLSNLFPDALDAMDLKAATLVRKSVASRAGLREEALKNGRQVIDRYARVPGVVIGKAAFGKFEALVAGGAMPSAREGPPIVGLLASGALAHVDVELSLAERRLRLFKPTECKDPPVYWGAAFTSVRSSYDDTGTLSFTMQLDGQDILTAFDTAHRESTLDARATQRFFGFAPDAPELERVTNPGGDTTTFRVMTLSAEGLSVRNTRVRLYAKSDDCFLSQLSLLGIGYANCFNVTPLVIGSDLLQRLRLIVASRQERIYFTAATPPPPPPAPGGP